LLLAPDPGIFIKNISNPVDSETKDTLVKMYQITNLFHKESNENYIEIVNIKVLYTFAF
jgi:hypothetical protein